MSISPVPSQDIRSWSRWVSAPVTIGMSTTSARSTQLTPGMYRVSANGACYYRQGGSTVTVSTATGFLLSQYRADDVYVSGESDDYIAVIVSTGGGSMWIQRKE